MQCNKCGRNNPDNYRNCMGCGNELTGATDNGYQNNNYQNGYQNNGYQNNGYQQQNQWNSQPANNNQYNQYGQQNQPYQQNQQNGQYYQGNQYAQPQQNYPVQNGGSDKKKTVIALVSVAVVIYLIIMAGVGVYYAKNKDSDKSSKSSKSSSSSRYNIDDEDDDDDEEETTKKTTTTKAATTTQSNKDNYGNIKPDVYYDGNTYYVNADVGLYLRKGPRESYDYITLLDYATKVVVRGGNDNNGDWYYVYVESLGKYGWVNNAYLSTSRPSTVTNNESYIRYNSSFNCRVNTTEGLYLRTRPSSNSSYVSLLPYNQSVTVLGYSTSDPSWYYVRTYISGSYYYGYCYSLYLS